MDLHCTRACKSQSIISNSGRKWRHLDGNRGNTTKEYHKTKQLKSRKAIILSSIALFLVIVAYTVVAVYNTTSVLEDQDAEAIRGQFITDIHMFIESCGYMFIWFSLWKYFRAKNEVGFATLFNLWFWLQVANTGDELFHQNTGPLSVWEYIFASIAVLSAIIEYRGGTTMQVLIFICIGAWSWIRRMLNKSYQWIRRKLSL